MSFARLEKFIFEKLSAMNTPALSIALREGDEIIWSRGFGFRSVEQRKGATAGTNYDVASITKSFTGAAILRLAERGQIDLEAPVSQYLPKFAIRPFGETIRVKHLLNHTSGLPGLGSSTRMKGALIGTRDDLMPIVTFEDYLLFMDGAEDWAVARPGEKFFYSNEGYALLGYIIQEVAGTTYEQHIKANLLDPLEMTRSYFAQKDVEADPDVATLYAILDGRLTPMPYPYRDVNAFSGMVSNVTDLTKFAAMLINGGEYRGTRVLAPETAKLMLTPQQPIYEKEGRYKAGYGLEFIQDFFGHTLAGHGGWIDISAGYLGFLPDKRVSVAVQINCAGYLPDFFAMYALALYLGEDPEALPFLVRDRMLAELTGTYRTFKDTIEARVKRMGGFLALELRYEKHRTVILPLAPEELEEERRTFYTMALTLRQNVEFRVKDGKIAFIYERFLFRKISG